mgnify:FL=1
MKHILSIIMLGISAAAIAQTPQNQTQLQQSLQNMPQQPQEQFRQQKTDITTIPQNGTITRSVRDVMTPPALTPEQQAANAAAAEANSQDLTTIMQQAPLFPGTFGPTVMPQESWAVNPHDFQELLESINDQTFASEQLPMVQAAGLCGWFTCSQCAALMNLFDFDDNRLKVVSYLAPHLIDPIRCQPIMDQLAYISDRQTAWKIISAARP